jgi:methylglutaconyl-CoA hydratase
MTSRALASALDRGVLTLTLDRPEKRNALNTELVDALHLALDRADLDAAVRVVVLRGAGKDFCAGADLAELLASADRALDENEHDARRLGLVFERIRSLPKPVIAAVHGRALAGGAGLATACDVVVAGASSQLGYPEIDRGFVPAMVMTVLRRLVGERVAFDLVATGRVLGAEEARQIGLVTRVVGDDRVTDEAQAIALRMVGGSATALALTKRLLYDLDGVSFADGIALGARVNAAARATPDFQQAISRFLHR